MKQYYSKVIKNLITIVGALGLLLVLAVGYQCGVQKVCKLELVEREVRVRKEITLPKSKIIVEIVDTDKARVQGLSGRQGLNENEGMLFVFGQSGTYTFWMKDMLFPIDIVWINEEGVVVHVEHNATPESYANFIPPKTFSNVPAAKYVLEISANTAERHGLYLGTKVKLGE